MALSNTLAGFAAYTEEEEKKRHEQPIPPAPSLEGMMPRERSYSPSEPTIVNQTRQIQADAAVQAQQAVTDAFAAGYQREAAPSLTDFRGSSDEKSLKGQAEMLGQKKDIGIVGQDVREGLMHQQAPSWIEQLQSAADQARQNDAQAQRHEQSRKYIAGIGDAISSIANIVYTTKGAPSQPQTYMMPGVNASVERERERRKRDYDLINARLESAKAQQAKMETQKEIARINSQVKAARSSGKSDAEIQSLLNHRKALEDKWKKDMEFKQSEAERKQGNEEANRAIRARNASTSAYNAQTSRIRAEKSGMTDSQVMNAKRNNLTPMKEEIAQANGYSSWAEFSARENRGNLSAEQKQMIAGLNSTNPNDQAGAINQYQSLAPKWKAQMDAMTGSATVSSPAPAQSGKKTVAGFSDAKEEKKENNGKKSISGF